MDKQHVERMIQILGSNVFTPLSKSFIDDPYGEQRGNTVRREWKWLIREFGKQRCIRALLPYIEPVTYLRKTPYLEYCGDNRNVDVENFHLEMFELQISHITNWANQPSKEIKQALNDIKAKQRERRFGLSDCAGPQPRGLANNFINSLASIIVHDSHNFYYYVFIALNELGCMGYRPWHVSFVFQHNLLHAYECELAELNGE